MTDARKKAEEKARSVASNIWLSSGSVEDAVRIIESALLAARNEALEEAAAVAENEAVSESSWALKYAAEPDEVAMNQAKGGALAAKEIARDIAALKEQR